MDLIHGSRKIILYPLYLFVIGGEQKQMTAMPTSAVRERTKNYHSQ